MTINDSWGYQAHDSNHKSVRQLVRILAEVTVLKVELNGPLDLYDGSGEPLEQD